MLLLWSSEGHGFGCALFRARVGARDPEERLADGEGALELRDGGVGWEGLPEVGVFGTAVGAGSEEQAGRADG